MNSETRRMHTGQGGAGGVGGAISRPSKARVGSGATLLCAMPAWCVGGVRCGAWLVAGVHHGLSLLALSFYGWKPGAHRDFLPERETLTDKAGVAWPASERGDAELGVATAGGEVVRLLPLATARGGSPARVRRTCPSPPRRGPSTPGSFVK